jgi:hypothetical protein
MLSLKDSRFIRYVRNQFAIRDVPDKEDDGGCDLSFNINDPTAPEAYRERDEFLGCAETGCTGGAANFPECRLFQAQAGVITIVKRVLITNQSAAPVNILVNLVKATAALWGAAVGEAGGQFVNGYLDTRNSFPLGAHPAVTLGAPANTGVIVGFDYNLNMRLFNQVPANETVVFDTPVILALGPDGRPWGIEVSQQTVNTTMEVHFDFVERTPNIIERNLAG